VLKPTAFKVILSLVMGLGLFLVLARVPHAMFPCEVEVKGSSEPKETTCQLYVIASDKGPVGVSSFTAGGYALFGLLFVAIPIIVGFVVGHKLEKKSEGT